MAYDENQIYFITISVVGVKTIEKIDHIFCLPLIQIDIRRAFKCVSVCLCIRFIVIDMCVYVLLTCIAYSHNAHIHIYYFYDILMITNGFELLLWMTPSCSFFSYFSVVVFSCYAFGCRIHWKVERVWG